MPRLGHATRQIALWALVGVSLALDADILDHLNGRPLGWDFSCFWAGARVALSDPAGIYDFGRVTLEQGALAAGRGVRPFIYPPSALPIFLPLGRLDHWTAYALWLIVTFGIYLLAAARLRLSLAGWALLVTAPPVLLVALSGQITALVAGLTLLGLTMPRRSRLAGVLLGLAAVLKPQLLVLLPLALLAERRWTQMGAVALTSLAAVAASLLFGWQRWIEWFAALRAFNRLVVDDPEMLRVMLTPTAAALRLGVSGPLLLAVQSALAMLGAGLVWRTFRANDCPSKRAIALFGGALLVTPYGLNYELALLAPGVAAMVSRTDEKVWASRLAAAFVMQLTTFGLGAIGLLATLGLLLVAPARGRASAAGPEGASIPPRP